MLLLLVTLAVACHALNDGSVYSVDMHEGGASASCNSHEFGHVGPSISASMTTSTNTNSLESAVTITTTSTTYQTVTCQSDQPIVSTDTLPNSAIVLSESHSTDHTDANTVSSFTTSLSTSTDSPGIATSVVYVTLSVSSQDRSTTTTTVLLTQSTSTVIETASRAKTRVCPRANIPCWGH